MFSAVKKLFSPSIVLPSPDWVHEANQRTQFTPDIAFLEAYELQPVFVVEEFQSMFKRFGMLKEGLVHSLGHAFTEEKFLMWKKPLGLESYPVPIVATEQNTSIVPWYPKPLPIKGELYAIRPYTFMELDKHKANGVQFVRRRVKIHRPLRAVVRLPVEKGLEHISRTERLLRYEHVAPKVALSDEFIHKYTAWMYVGRDEYWADQYGESAYDSRLKIVKTFEPNRDGLIKRYSQFTRYEIK